MTIKKRFIAGAICPKCGLPDKTVVYSIANKNFAECVHCGYKQEAIDNKASSKSGSKKIIWIKKSD
ncbi:MAG: hypothetical protein A3E87_02500 [Gammaproteobacteria bacterium RIFCSPHIGHO2_12_FULL_35_23]|nr:MAG: hypothetical protein A3E87_02500 [Gammaproteobacteria bacterium RIFCSPHIGHO2_12_FULL_35_23]